jgi:uncharacterized protein with PIN domain
MKFIADSMLGRLARWLRILGFDTLYFKDISDKEILRIARQQGRLILTRDTHFRNFKNFTDVILLNSNDTRGQLLEVIKALDIDIRSPQFTVHSPRCTKCNGMLTEVVEKKEVSGLVPEYVYIRYGRFLRCEDCGNIYWEGSHIKKFRKKVF